MVLCLRQIAFIIMLIDDILNRDCVQIHQTCLLHLLLDLLYDLDRWPACDLDLGFSRSNFPIVVSGRVSLLGMKWKWYELTRCWTHNMTLTFDPTHDFDHVFLRSNLKTAIFQKCMGPALFRTFAHIYNKMNKSCKWQHEKEQTYGCGVSQTTV